MGERGAPLLSIELRGPWGKRKAHPEPELGSVHGKIETLVGDALGRFRFFFKR